MRKKSTTPRALNSSNDSSEDNKKVFDGLKKLIEQSADQPFEETQSEMSAHEDESIVSSARRMANEHRQIYNTARKYAALMNAKRYS